MTVRVLDTPSEPTEVAIKDVKEDTGQITWAAPVIDRGAQVNNYIVEKLLSGRKAWSTATVYLWSTCVKGENEYGVGDAAEIGLVRVCVTPGPVNIFKVVDFSKTNAKLAWSRPVSDGGSRITNYVID